MADGNIWDLEPGSVALATVQEDLADRMAKRVSSALPASIQNVVSVEQVRGSVTTAIQAAEKLAAGASLINVAGALYAGLSTVNGALNKIAKLLREEIDEGWSSAMDSLAAGLIQNAGGKILATYQPADEITLKRAQSYTSSGYKDGKIHKLSTLVEQFRPGYVVGVERPGRSDYIAATVPVLTFTGHPLGATIAESIYADNPGAWRIGPLGDDWGANNVWDPLGLTDYFTGMPFPEWVILARQLKYAHGCPPVRDRILVAPGLCPFWGPRGEQLPMGPRMVAYAAALLAKPPPDLDFVAQKLADADWLDVGVFDAKKTGILELLWAREDQARRKNPAAGAPRGVDWPGPLGKLVYGEDWSPSSGIPDGPGGEGGAGGGKRPGGGGMAGEGVGGIKAPAPSSGGGALLGLGLGALALGGGAIVARQVFGGKKGRRSPAKRSAKRSIWRRKR